MAETEIKIESATALSQTTAPGVVPTYFNLSQNPDKTLRRASEALTTLKFESSGVTLEKDDNTVIVSLTRELDKGIYQVSPVLPSVESGLNPADYMAQFCRGPVTYLIDKPIVLVPGDRLKLKDIEIVLPENIQIEDPELFQSFPHLNRPLKETIILNQRNQGMSAGRTSYGSFAALTDVGFVSEEVTRFNDSAGDEVEFRNVLLGRSANQDCIGIVSRFDGTSLFVVADGMGGEEGGEIASLRSTNSILYHFRHGCPLPWAFINARNELFEYAHNTDPWLIDRMGTVVCAAEVAKEQVSFHYVGDSRGYLLRQQEQGWSVVHRTTDHTEFGKMIKFDIPINKAPMNDQRIREWRDSSDPEVRAKYREYSSPNKYIVSSPPLNFPPELITRDRAYPTTEPMPILPNDILILCSDGLWGTFFDAEISAIVEREKTPEGIRQALYKDAISFMDTNHKGIDNISILVYQHQPKV